MTDEHARWRPASRFFCALLVLIGMLLASGASAQSETLEGEPRRDRRPPPHHRLGPPLLDRVLEENAERLSLTEETQEHIREYAVRGREKSRPHRAKLRALHRELRDLLGQEAPDEAAVMAQAERIGALETTLQKQRLGTMLSIRALLTPEQRAELVRIHEERKATRSRRGGPMGERRGPPRPRY